MTLPLDRVGDALRKVNNSHRLINWGGCGAMAAIIAEQLESHVDDMRIVSCGWESGDIDEARNMVQQNAVYEWNKAGIRFAHVWVECLIDGEWWAFDSEGPKSLDAQHGSWGKPFAGSFTVDEMRELGEQEDGWNSSFDRGQIPSMRNMFEQSMRTVLNK